MSNVSRGKFTTCFLFCRHEFTDIYILWLDHTYSLSHTQSHSVVLSQTHNQSHFLTLWRACFLLKSQTVLVFCLTTGLSIDKLLRSLDKFKIVDVGDEDIPGFLLADEQEDTSFQVSECLEWKCRWWPNGKLRPELSFDDFCLNWSKLSKYNLIFSPVSLFAYFCLLGACGSEWDCQQKEMSCDRSELT